MPNVNSTCGFSLIEALVALMILAIGLTGVVKLQTVIMGASALSQQRNEATHIAQDKIEHLRGYTRLSATPGELAYEDIGSSTAAESISGVNASYSRTWTVCCADTASVVCPPSPCPADHLWKEITVTVGWTDKDGDAHSVELETKIAKLDPANDAALLVSASTSSSTSGSSTTTTSSTTTSSTSTSSGDTSTTTSSTSGDSSTTTSSTSTTSSSGGGTTYECECHYQNEKQRFSSVEGGGCCTLELCRSVFPGDYDNNSDHETRCTE